ncbi:MAG: ABC transporter ATP-binding protein [Spirochaetia bacterium]|nr:ABC transporter ATP-binding protein [Spirochaetia bacterium]
MNKNSITEEYSIEISGLSKMYKMYSSKRSRLKEAVNPFGRKYYNEFWALKDINLKIKKGEVLGIVGRNGSGKSTLLKIISGIIQPTKGTVKVNGKISALLEVGSGMNPQLTGRENIRFLGQIMGYEAAEMDKHEKDIIDFAELGPHIDQPFRTYSSGMRSKLGFAISTAVKPEILILDEVLSVGDALFRRKAFARMEDLIKDENTTVLFVSHNDQNIIQICTYAILLKEGALLLESSTKNVTKYYQKMLFSTETELKSILKEIKNEIKVPQESDGMMSTEYKNSNNFSKKLNIEKNNHKDMHKTSKLDAYYTANMKSKSSSILVESDTKVIGAEIKTLDDEIVNNLPLYQKFKIVVKYVSKKEQMIRFSILIADDKFNILTGYYHNGQKSKKSVRAYPGENRIEVLFENKLVVGLYFISFSIYHEDGKLLYAERDRAVFRSFSNSRKKNPGFVELFDEEYLTFH